MKTNSHRALPALLAGLFALSATPGLAAEIDGSPAAVEAAWTRFLREADADAVYQAYSNALAVEDDDQQVSAEACREHAVALDKAVATVPVGLTIQYNAYRCAELLGDEETAERQLAWFSALARFALASAPQDWDAAPIRVVAGRDIYTLLEASGLEFRYQSLETSPQRRHLMVQVAAWDPEDKRERHLHFDFVDTYVQLSRQDGRSAFPAFRKSYQDNVIRQFAEQNQIMGVDQDSVRRAYGSDDPAERVTLLRPAAEIGGVNAAFVWMLACREDPIPGCGEGLVDALLPAAEKEYGTPTILLALAHSYGVGVEKDERAGLVLLDAADRIMGPGRATIDYARYVLGMGETFSDALEQRLAKAAARGLSAATVLLAISHADPESELWTASDLAAVQAAAEAGSASATAAMAMQLRRRGDDTQAVKWLAKAAAIGNAESQDTYSRYLAEGRGTAKDPVASRTWRLQAAAGGDTDAMLSLGWEAWGKKQGRDAELWFVSAAMYGSREAVFELAGLYSEDLEGVEGKPARGVALLKDLEQTSDGPKARRFLAELHLRGVGVEKDPAKARAYYLQDAERDDRESQAMLGLAMMKGDFGVPEVAEGEAWVNKAIAGGYTPAIDGLAFHYFYRVGEKAGRARALEMWRGALDAEDNQLVLNNLAWVLCATPHEDAYSPEEGVVIARRLAESEFLPSGEIDTIAACLAANGEFAEAVTRQEEAIAELVQYNPEDDSLPGMRDRLALYRSGKAYRESGTPGDEAP